MIPSVEVSLTEFNRYFEVAPEITTKAAMLAINQVASRGALATFREAIQKETAFPAGYTGDQRLYVSSKATLRDLEATITGRFRPTSLARFVQGSPPITGNRTGGIKLMVNPGEETEMPNAFLVRLKAGASLTQDNYNIGLAIRLKPGQVIHNKRKQSPIQLDHNVYILYGPSVDQVFRNVAEDESDVVLEQVTAEFFRQFARLSEEAL